MSTIPGGHDAGLAVRATAARPIAPAMAAPREPARRRAATARALGSVVPPIEGRASGARAGAVSSIGAGAGVRDRIGKRRARDLRDRLGERALVELGTG